MMTGKKECDCQNLDDKVSVGLTISLRKQESISIYLIIRFRQSEETRFFENLAQVTETEKFNESRIYGTSMSTVQQQRTKILTKTGKKQVGMIVSAQKAEAITAVACISASGFFVPPMLLFPRRKLKPHILNDPPLGSIGATSPSGWINGNLCLKWLNDFIKRSDSSIDHKVLLILDNHESHMKLQA